MPETPARPTECDKAYAEVQPPGADARARITTTGVHHDSKSQHRPIKSPIVTPAAAPVENRQATDRVEGTSPWTAFAVEPREGGSHTSPIQRLACTRVTAPTGPTEA